MTKRVKKHKKRKIKILRVIIAVVILAVIGYSAYKLLELTTKKIILKPYYLAADTPSIVLNSYDEETKKLTESKTLPRGTKVKSGFLTKTFDEKEYIEINYEDNKYYLDSKYLVTNKKEVIKDKTKYVRTSVTVYKNEKDSKIASFIKKGNMLEVLDYDNYDKDGIVNMYKIKKDDIEGWVYGKYLVDTEEDAKAVYNENGTYDKHKDRKYYFELYGGKASTLDYYPYERIEFENNKLLKVAKTMYLNAGGNVIGNIDGYIDIAKSSGVNAIVVDLKDGALGYPIEVAKEYSKTA